MTVEVNLLSLLHKAKAAEENIPAHGKADIAKRKQTIAYFHARQTSTEARYTAPLVTLGAVASSHKPKKDKP